MPPFSSRRSNERPAQASEPGAVPRCDRVKTLELQEYALAIVVVLLFVAGAILKPDTFPTWDNIRNMLTQASVIGVLAIGMTFVIATAGIDLSVGSMVAAAGVFGGILVGDDGTSSLVFILGAIAFATVLGTVNATAVAYGRVGPVHRDARDVLDRPGDRVAPQRQAAGQPARPERRLVRRAGHVLAALVRQRPDRGDPRLGLRLPRDHGGRLGAPEPHALRALRRGGRRQPRGRAHRRRPRPEDHLQRLRAVRPPRRVAAVLLCARLGSASPVSGNLYELDAIGAVVIGGTSLAGGRATIVGTFLGVLTFALIFSLMTQLNLSTEVQQVTKGLIVLGAVLLQRPEARY